jgi:hypothetical protein
MRLLLIALTLSTFANACEFTCTVSGWTMTDSTCPSGYWCTPGARDAACGLGSPTGGKKPGVCMGMPLEKSDAREVRQSLAQK